MRVLAALVLPLALATPAAAFSLEVPALRAPALDIGDLSALALHGGAGLLEAPIGAPLGEAVDLDVLAAGAGPADLFFATPSLRIPPRFGWILDDGRAFWFAAGLSAVTALGTHILVGLPVTFIGFAVAAAAGLSSPAVMVPILLGIGSIYFLSQSALSAAAAWLTFNGSSAVYEGNYATSLASHVGGTVAGVAVSGLTFGVGTLLIGGLNELALFTGSAGINAVAVFSLLGALPAVVIGGIALVGVPAVIGAWGLAVTATPKPGYSIDPQWRNPTPPSPASPTANAARAAGDSAAVTLVALPLPAP